MSEVEEMEIYSVEVSRYDSVPDLLRVRMIDKAQTNARIILEHD